MEANRAVKLSLGQVSCVRLLSAGLIILIIFYMSKADARMSPSTISTGEGDQCQEDGSGLAGASEEIGRFGKPRISGGNSTSPGEFPFHVGVYSRGDYICGGVLIDDHRILTSNDCSRFDLNGMQVKLGDHNRIAADGELTLSVRRILNHPTTNLAILVVDPIKQRTLIRRGSISPIKLPTGSQNAQGELIVTGWGSDYFHGPHSDYLKKATISVTGCRLPEKGIFCSQQNRAGPCRGDSGSPVFKPDGGNGYKLIGIVSGTNCIGECNHPLCDHLYVDISEYLEWINSSV